MFTELFLSLIAKFKGNNADFLKDLLNLGCNKQSLNFIKLKI